MGVDTSTPEQFSTRTQLLCIVYALYKFRVYVFGHNFYNPVDMHGFGIKGYPGPPGWGLGEKLTILPSKSHIFVEKLLKLETGRKQQRRHSMYKD